jgi:hypothetical protein
MDNGWFRIPHHVGTRSWGFRKSGANQAAEKRASATILSPFAVFLSIDSLGAAHDRQKLGPRKGSADLFFRSAAFPCPSGTCRGPKKQVRATLPRPEFLPILGSRKAVDAQNDSERARDDSI